MAITIETEPQDYNTASNPCVFTFSSDQTGQDNYSFYIELTVNGAVHSYHTVFPESSNYGKFDCSSIIKTFVSSELIIDGSYVSPSLNEMCTYSISVRDKYGDPPVLQGSWAASSTRNAFNGAFRHQDWLDWDYSNYDSTTQSVITAEWLSNMPYKEVNQYCSMTESQFVAIFCTDTAARVVTTIFDVTDSIVATATTNITLPAKDFVLLNVSPTALIANTTHTTTHFNQGYYYKVKFDAQGGGPNSGISKEFQIYIDRECTQYTHRRLHWLNKFGAWDSYSFILYSEESTDIKSQTYSTDEGNWNSSNAWEYNRYTGSNKVYQKSSMDKMKLNSDWMKQAKQQWLVKSLYESPKVYLEVSYGVFEPVHIEQKTFKLKQRIREGLIREEVTIMRTYQYTSQLN